MPPSPSSPWISYGPILRGVTSVTVKTTSLACRHQALEIVGPAADPTRGRLVLAELSQLFLRLGKGAADAPPILDRVLLAGQDLDRNLVVTGIGKPPKALLE